MKIPPKNSSKLCRVQDQYKLKYGLWISLEEIQFIIIQYDFINKAMPIAKPSKQIITGGV